MYNGNISETYWKTNTDVTKRSYGYQYDNLNRLTSAIYSKPNDAIPISGAYNESLSYDKNGNIKSLQRYGASDAPSIVFQTDDLTYGYLNENSNRLTKVTDGPAGNDNEGFKDGNKTGDDFTYDANGNMIGDKNKNITEIQYNQLNLPKKITFGTSGRIEYIYNATGQKLEKIVKETSGTVHTDYLVGFQYKYSEGQDGGNQGGGNDDGGDPPAPDDPGNTDPPIDGTDPVKDPPVEANRFSAFAAQSVSQAVPSRPTLEFFPTAEGYYDNIGKKYVYQYKDHLGSIRLSYAKNPVTQVLTIIDENNYYPFGLKHEGYNMDGLQPEYKYKFQGQERQDELGLNWDSFKYRNYDMAIGRFMSIDPLAEEYAYNSTYAFAENKLGMGRELEGLELGPLFGVAEIIKVSAEVGAKTSEVVGKTSEVTGKATEGSGRFTETQLKNFARGNATETEQLAKNGIEKNTKPIEAVDPKTGQKGTTIPDGLEGGKTTEVKDVKYQGLTRQLRLQKEYSNGNGANPELIINQSAKISKPLQKAGFDIKTYSTSGTTIESTGVPKPKIVPIASSKLEIKIISVLPGIH